MSTVIFLCQAILFYMIVGAVFGAFVCSRWGQRLIGCDETIDDEDRFWLVLLCAFLWPFLVLVYLLSIIEAEDPPPPY